MELALSMVLLFVGVVVLVVIHICIVARTFRGGGYGGGRSVNMVEIRSNNNNNIICTKKMSDEELKKLPTFEYKAGDPNNSDCVVCLENFRKGDNCKLLPNCSHRFHSQCIDSWLLKTPICPICRTCADDLPKVGLILGDHEEEEEEDQV